MRNPIRVFACLCLFAASGHAHADDGYAWRNVRVGGGGFSPGIVFSRAERGLAYLRTDIGGVYRWDGRADRWIALQDHLPQSNYFGIESVAPDPHDADVVLVAAGMYRRDGAAILRSFDRGQTWDIFPTAFRMGGNEDGRGLGERLAIDPNEPSIVYFASRHDGLQRSADRGRTWSRVDSFPYEGRGVPPPGPTNAGLSFVVLDASSASRDQPTRRIYVGVADPGEAKILRSEDAGANWIAVDNPAAGSLLPVQAQVNARGVLYVTYASSMGPNGITNGAVFRFDAHRDEWTDITPDKSSTRPPGGYMGLSIDRQQPDTLIVATVNRWEPGDTLWRSRDGGNTWASLREISDRDVSATPFLRWGEAHAEFGHWMSGVAIDPFDSSHVAYTTGATVYATRQLSKDSGKRVLWKPWVEGVEETAVIALMSPPLGPPLLSGFGDLSGFVHEQLDRSPEIMFVDPTFTNTVFLDYAGQAPNVVVRGGRARLPRGADRDSAITLAWSEDFGRTWKPLQVPAQDGLRSDTNGDVAIAVSADGANIIASTRMPMLTRDRGASWRRAEGLARGVRVIADRAHATTFYALDFDDRRVSISQDGGSSFATLSTTGLPQDIARDRPMNPEHPWPFVATPGRTGDLWFVGSKGLYRSRDGGRSFEHVPSDVTVSALSFGKAAPGRDYPSLFAIGHDEDLRALWRSDDAGRTWIRINDEQHEYGRRYRVIAGDPRVFGRVYVGTDGRGIVVGEPRP